MHILSDIIIFERMRFFLIKVTLSNEILLNYLEEKVNHNEPFSKELILSVQKLVEKGIIAY